MPVVQHLSMHLTPFRAKPNLHARLAKRLPDLLGLTLEQVTSEVSFYRHLDPDHISHDVSLVTARNLQLFVRLLLEGRLPERSDVEFMMRSAASRAEERVPLPEVLAAYYAGFRACWDQLLEVADPDDLGEVVEIGNLVLADLQVVTTAVTESYFEATTALSGGAHEARSKLLSFVLEGTDTVEHWHAAGWTPWAQRSVIHLRHRAPRSADQLRVQVEARRRARAIRDALCELTDAEVLDSLCPTGGTIVVHGEVEAARLQSTLGRVLRGRWYAGLAHAPTRAGTPEALSAAEDCAEVADRLRYTPGVHVLENLVLEVQVTRPGPARSSLERMLAPLDQHPELVATLSAYVEQAGRRAETAARLHVHPNTLDYRLRRIHQLTGVDASDHDGGQLARAALVVRQFVRGQATGPTRSRTR